MDEFDRSLKRLPSQPCPPGMAMRIIHNLERRRRRIFWLQNTACTVLAVFGMWLAAPMLTRLVSNLDLPKTALPWVVDLVGMASNGSGEVVNRALVGVNTSQHLLTGSMTIGSLIGLAFIALAALVGVQRVIPFRIQTTGADLVLGER